MAGLIERIITELLPPERGDDAARPSHDTTYMDSEQQAGCMDLDHALVDHALKVGPEFGLVNPDAIAAWRSYFASAEIPSLERTEALYHIVSTALTHRLAESPEF